MLSLINVNLFKYRDFNKRFDTYKKSLAFAAMKVIGASISIACFHVNPIKLCFGHSICLFKQAYIIRIKSGFRLHIRIETQQNHRGNLIQLSCVRINALLVGFFSVWPGFNVVRFKLYRFQNWTFFGFLINVFVYLFYTRLCAIYIVFVRVFF